MNIANYVQCIAQDMSPLIVFHFVVHQYLSRLALQTVTLTKDFQLLLFHLFWLMLISFPMTTASLVLTAGICMYICLSLKLLKF